MNSKYEVSWQQHIRSLRTMVKYNRLSELHKICAE